MRRDAKPILLSDHAAHMAAARGTNVGQIRLCIRDADRSRMYQREGETRTRFERGFSRRRCLVVIAKEEPEWIRVITSFWK